MTLWPIGSTTLRSVDSDQCVLGSLTILIDQSDFHNFFSFYRCISADKLTEIWY